MPCPNHALPSPPWLHSRSRKGLPSHLSPSGRACASGAPASTRSRHSDRRMMDLTVAHRSSIPDRKSREHHVKLKARDRVDVYRYAICWHWQHGHFGAMICTVYEEWREVRGAVGLGAAVTKSDKHDRGDPAGAERAYQLAIDSGHGDRAPKAAFNLGVLREDRGDDAGAERAHQLAIDSGHADQAPQAAVNLGVLRHGLEDYAGAECVFHWRSTAVMPTWPRRRRSTSGCSVRVAATSPGRSGPTSWPSTPGIQRRLHLRERRSSSYGEATPSLDRRAEQVFLLAVDAVLWRHFLSADPDGQPLPYRRIKGW